MQKLKKQYSELGGRELAAISCRIASDTKAEDLVVLDLRGLTTFTDYFVIISGRSTRHVQGLAEAIEGELSAKRITTKNCEGLSEGLWVLLDFDDLVIHIFYHDTRKFYDLEGLWHDAPRIDPEALVAEIMEDEARP
ncbi:ribosome silencing factor [Desulfolithobacter sp.]